MRYPMLAFLAGLLGLIGLGALGYYITTWPTTLKVAVGPVSNENVRIVAAAIQTFQKEREPFRLRLITTDGGAQSSAALDAGKADLAIVRSDIAYPRNGASVAIMRVDHVLLVAPGTSNIRTAADLKDKVVAIVQNNAGNAKLVSTIAVQAGLLETDVKTDGTRLADMRAALEQGKIHAVLAVGPTSGRLLFDIVNIVTDAGHGKITFIPVPEASAIEQRYPLLEADTLVRGLFGGQTPRPEKDIPTITVSHHLLASKNLPETTVSDFTRVLLNAKLQIAAEAPLASKIEAPDQEKTSPIPIHPGTITYLDGQTTTFLERYGDWFYIAIMSLGLGGSFLAGYLSYAAAQTRKGVMGMLSDLERVILDVRTAGDEKTLSTLADQTDSLFNRTLKQATNNNVDPAAMTAFNMAFNQANHAIAERRKSIRTKQQ
jgi:TRAP transporter TAXI family solute receptor